MGMKSDKELPQPATVNAGDFPLGSPESRAAARAMAKAQEAEQPIIIFRFDLGDGKPIIIPFFRTKRE